MEINRDHYLQQLIDSQWDGQAKVITGIRRCGKSFLLHTLFRNYLISNGVDESHILTYRLDLVKDVRFRNPMVLASTVRERVEGQSDQYYLFVDEIQMSRKLPNPYDPDGVEITFYDALNDLLTLDNLDIYVTGSNSKMLASDILTEFRGRGHEIRLHPLTFGEIYSTIGGDRNEIFDQYMFYGGMPVALLRKSDTAKMSYLKSLFAEVYVKDILQRKKIQHPELLEPLIDVLSSAIGSLSNPTNIYNAMVSANNIKESLNTIVQYIDYLKDAFLFSECRQYDVKGKNYLRQPFKYYSEDVGLRNARLGFRQQEATHIVENIVYNELVARGFSVDVGVVKTNEMKNGKMTGLSKEIDFIATGGNGKKFYIQTAYMMPTPEKEQSERKSLLLVRNAFPKIIVQRDTVRRWYDDDGILHVNLIDFLLDESILK
ncbi:MAG: ATP-binding protein [Victivallales bacterium]|nr:ATP-binding protein [Victivallales bacterium]